MKYQSGGAFRHALEDRLRAQSLASGMALVRLRKMIAFDRFLARLILAQPDAWVLKGGLALQLRLGKRARTTKDVDVLLQTPYQDIHQLLVRAASLDVGDWFQFEVMRSTDSTQDLLADCVFILKVFWMDVLLNDSTWILVLVIRLWNRWNTLPCQHCWNSPIFARLLSPHAATCREGSCLHTSPSLR